VSFAFFRAYSRIRQIPIIKRFSVTSTALLLMQTQICGKLLPFPICVMTTVASRIFTGLLFDLVQPGPQEKLPGLLPAMQVFPDSKSFTNERR
jgi:hypothetical protein